MEALDFSDCGLSAYYDAISTTGSSDPLMWTRLDLEQLVTNTHRNSLALLDLFPALIDLDQAPTPNDNNADPDLVRLIYSGESVPAVPYNTPTGWTNEPLWPESRGAVGSFAFTDVHNNRPEDTRVTFRRGDLLFGECDTVELADACEQPAFVGAPNGTTTDGKVWAPPLSVRGDIARALFYMDLRYRSSTDLNLALTDCPPFDTGKMGILSQLLEWHREDPVSNDELERNQKACQLYQGNRNPFVDYPELATVIFGAPQEILEGTRTYPSCLDIPTSAPTMTPNECDMLAPGDVFIYAVESIPPAGIGFLALADIPAGLELYLTDNPWDGTAFVPLEGTLLLTVPNAGIQAGESFGFGFDYGFNQTWIAEEGDFNLTSENQMGDSIFVYCYGSDGTVQHLAGFSNANVWSPSGLEEYDDNQTALPNDLAEIGAIVLPYYQNYQFEGPVAGQKIELQQAMIDPNNWVGTNNWNATAAGNETSSEMPSEETLSPTDADGGHNIFASTMEPSGEDMAFNSSLPPSEVPSVLPVPSMIPSAAPVIAVNTEPVPSNASQHTGTTSLCLTMMLAAMNAFLTY